MATLKRFEDIEAWQVARKLTREIYTPSETGRFAVGFGLRDQIWGTAVSVMSTIAEGFERGGSNEFNRFLSIAKGSTGEIEAQMYVALDQNYIAKEQFDLIMGSAGSTNILIAGFMNDLKRSKINCQKYK